MITFLSGGTGTPKLLRGMQDLMDDRDVAVIVNTAEDMWLSGNHLSPDVDTVMYLFARILDVGKWWGIKGDSFATHEQAKKLGADEFIMVGDRDRATHIARGSMLRGGMTLTEATKILCANMGIEASILPMADTPVTTMIRTKDDFMHFQDYWVRHRGQVEIEGVERVAETPPVATPEVLAAIDTCDAVVIGPSNPVTSISPILECAGVRDALADKFVIAVSPFIGDQPISGPAAALMRAWGYKPSSAGTCMMYRSFIDVFIQDIRDTVAIPGSIKRDTLMVHRGKSMDLSRAILDIIETQRKR